MNTFHKQLITTKSTKRKIMILEILSNEPQGLSSVELMTKLNTSEKTLNLDISELNEITENKYIHAKKGIYSLLGNAEQLVLKVEHTLLENEPLFRILMSYYNDQNRTISEWSSKLYIADRTLERYLSKLKILANEYELKLKYKPISFKGSEVNIRLFFHDFLADTNLLNYQSALEYQLYLSILDYVQNHTTLHPTVKINSILCWIMIVKKRIQGGYYIPINKKMINMRINDDNKVYYKKIWDLLNINCPDHINENEFTFMTLIHNHLGYYSNEIMFSYLNEINNDEEIFFLELIKTFNIHYSLRLKMYHAYKSYLFNVRQLTLLSPLFQKNNPDLNEYVKNKYSTHFRKVKHLFGKYAIKFENNQLIYVDDVMVNITLIVSSYKIHSQKNKKKVGLFITGNMNLVLLMQEKLNILKPENIEFHFFSYEEISITNLNIIGIDKFITNSEYIYSILSYSNVEIIKISPYPTESDWIKIIIFFMKVLK